MGWDNDRLHDHEHEHDHERGHERGHDHDREQGQDGHIRGRDQDGGHGHGHGGPGHSHAHATVDRAMEDNAEGVRALKLSIVGLAVTAGLQAIVVVFSGSVALLSDTLHNLADAGTALPLWLAFNVGRRPPNRRFTYGYGRAEDLAGVIIVAVIAGSGVLAAWESIQRLRHPSPVEHIPWVMAAAVIGALGNEAVALYRIRTGRRIGSAALVADGLHARADGLTSLAVLLGAIGVALGWERADAVAGLLIAVAIVAVLAQAAVGVGTRLMDAVSPELVDRAERVVAAAPGVEGVSELRIRWIGHRLRAETRITVDRDLDVATAHEISEDAHHALLHELPMLSSAVVHIDPCQHAGPDPHASTAHHFGEPSAGDGDGGHADRRSRPSKR